MDGPAPLDLHPIRVRRKADEVVEQIRRLIVDEGLQSGARLPAERDLARMFCTSRAVVSQALRSLSLMGLVDIRPGSGVYVLRNPRSMVATSMNLLLDLEEGSLADLVQLRLWLERLGATEAMRLAGERDLDRVREALDRLRATAASPSSWIAADALFHATLVGIAKNPYLTALYESVHTAIVSIQLEAWVRTDEPPGWLSPERAEERLALHRPILAALSARDPDALQAALNRHHQALMTNLEDHPRRRRLQPAPTTGHDGPGAESGRG
ncbi:MAG TPA: FadR/GntR family transcriptional regulator [Candidatus Dormibacteraeota bacterium]|nr:FadR/GntR family transcriptional regulator [Candidatus Dormibacteraeota bacterium]